MPTPDYTINDVPDLVLDDKDEDDEPYTGDDALEEGDHIFIVTIPCKAEFIRVTSGGILQKLQTKVIP